MATMSVPLQGLESRKDQSNPSNQSTTEADAVVDTKSNRAIRSRGEKRMTISLPQESGRMLELLSELQGVSQIEALRRAISTEAFIQREIQNGSRILAQSPDNQVKELVFR